MVEFFEMMNECSSGRTTLYLVFILMFTFVTFAGIADVISKIVGGDKIKVDDEKVKGNKNLNE